MRGGGEAPLNALAMSARQQLRGAIIAEQRASWVAAVVPIGLWLWVSRHPIVIGFVLPILIGMALRSRALPAIERGEIERAVVLFMIGKWGISIALVLVLPIALPIVVVNLIMPIALASTNLASHRFVPMIAASVVVAFVVAALGYTTNILDLEQDVTPWVWQWLCAIVLTVHFVPLSLILWRSNQQQALTFGEAIESNTRLRAADADLRQSRRRLVGAADAERSRIERDLHDGAQQRLVAVLVQWRLANRLAAKRMEAQDSESHDEVAPAARLIEANEILADELEAAIDELRSLAHGIYPPLLKTGGLQRALAAVARRTPTNVDLTADGIGRFELDTEAAVYFCCLEAIQNAVKHDDIGDQDLVITIRLERASSVDGATMLSGTVSDTGPGFDTADESDQGRGLQNMSDRIGAAGGVLEVDSSVGHGTTVSFELPVDDGDERQPRRAGVDADVEVGPDIEGAAV